MGELDDVTNEHGLELYNADGTLGFSSADTVWHFLDSFTVPANVPVDGGTNIFYSVANGYPEAYGKEVMHTVTLLEVPPQGVEQNAPRIILRDYRVGIPEPWINITNGDALVANGGTGGFATAACMIQVLVKL